MEAGRVDVPDFRGKKIIIKNVSATIFFATNVNVEAKSFFRLRVWAKESYLRCTISSIQKSEQVQWVRA